MAEWTERAELLFKKEGLDRLKNANILIVGVGGVGSFAAEFIARAGVGKMTIVDGDVVDITNINRQLPALHSTVGLPKIDIVGNRLLDINPELKLTKVKEFLSPERAFEIVTDEYDYVLDCIDSLTPKLNLIIAAKRKRVKIISSMGAGGKMEASKVKVADINNTVNCFLAKAMKSKLKAVKIDKLKVVFSIISVPVSQFVYFFRIIMSEVVTMKNSAVFHVRVMPIGWRIKNLALLKITGEEDISVRALQRA
jgi:tRNA A37 threonylcarbamoyladenosine dehydratase